MTISPQQAGDDLSQYTIQAVTSSGNGLLQASTGKTGKDHNYTQDLTAATALSPLYFVEGNALAFKAGNAVTIRCRYSEKEVKGEEGRVTITARVHDSVGNVVAIQE